MKIPKNIVMQFKRIPTRYDDITREIYEAKLMPYYKQFKPQETANTFKLGDVLGNKLNSIKDALNNENSLDKIV